MFAKGQIEQPKGYGTMIDASVSIEGSVSCESSIYMAGKLNGDLRSDDDVYVEADGLVNGNVRAKNICVSGTVEGAVEATGLLKITAKGRVFGDVHVFRLITEEGAVFDGRCTMSDVAVDAGAQRLPRGEARKLKNEAMFRKANYRDGSIPPLKGDQGIFPQDGM